MTALRVPVFAAALTLALAVAAVPAPVIAQQQNGECEGLPHCGPYSEDPGEGCLGHDDPFCNGGGGGGGSPDCLKCAFTDYGTYIEVSCIYVSEGRSECDIEVTNEEITCQTSGAFCDTIIVEG